LIVETKSKRDYLTMFTKLRPVLIVETKSKRDGLLDYVYQVKTCFDS